MSNSTSGAIDLSQSLKEMDVFIKGLDRLNKKVNGIFKNVSQKNKRSQKEITSYFKTLENGLSDFSRHSEKSFDSLTTNAETAFDSITKSAERSFGRIQFLLNSLNYKARASLYSGGGRPGVADGKEQESGYNLKDWLEMGAAVIAIGGVFGGVFRKMWKRPIVQKGLNTAYNAAKGLGPVIGTALSGIATGLRNTGQIFKGMMIPRIPKLMNVDKGIKSSMGMTISGMTTWAKNLGKGFSDWLGKASGKFSNIFKSKNPLKNKGTIITKDMQKEYNKGVPKAQKITNKNLRLHNSGVGKVLNRRRTVGKVAGVLAVGGALLGGALWSSNSKASDQYPSGEQGNPDEQGVPAEQDSGGFLSDALSFGAGLLALPGVTTALRVARTGLRVARLATPIGWASLAAEAFLTSDFVTDKVSSWWNGSDSNNNAETGRVVDVGPPRVSPGVMASTSKSMTCNFYNNQSYTISVPDDPTGQTIKVLRPAIVESNQLSEKAMIQYLGGLA